MYPVSFNRADILSLKFLNIPTLIVKKFSNKGDRDDSQFNLTRENNIKIL